jgi:hypothetical protein
MSNAGGYKRSLLTSVLKGEVLNDGPSDSDVYHLLRDLISSVDEVGDWFVVGQELTADGWVVSFQNLSGATARRRIRVETV